MKYPGGDNRKEHACGEDYLSLPKCTAPKLFFPNLKESIDHIILYLN